MVNNKRANWISCNQWKYRQLAIAPSPATVPVLSDAPIFAKIQCINIYNCDLPLFYMCQNLTHLLYCFYSATFCNCSSACWCRYNRLEYMYLQSLEYRQLAIIPSPATVPVLVDVDIISLDRCICNRSVISKLRT